MLCFEWQTILWKIVLTAFLCLGGLLFLVCFGTNARRIEGSWYDDDQGWDTRVSGNAPSDTEPDQWDEHGADEMLDSISDTSGTPPTAEELTIAANLMEAQIFFLNQR
jgi:hypothetical protein